MTVSNGLAIAHEHGKCFLVDTFPDEIEVSPEFANLIYAGEVRCARIIFVFDRVNARDVIGHYIEFSLENGSAVYAPMYEKNVYILWSAAHRPFTYATASESPRSAS